MSVPVAVLVSGAGTNLQALIDADLGPGKLTLVVSNVPGAPALDRARRAGIASAVLDHREIRPKSAFEQALTEALGRYGVQWVVLAGFMRVLGDVMLEAFPDRIVNIHPSLLPAFPGLDGPGQAYSAGVKVAGCTVHLVDAGVDTGPILAQTAVPVRADDTESSLRARILKAEHRLLPSVVRCLAEGRLRRAADRAWLDAATEAATTSLSGGIDLKPERE